MDAEALKRSLADSAPPTDASVPVQALWWAGKAEWDRAHALVQSCEGTPACDLVHAFLHRQEGDTGNASYWYRRAGQAMPGGSLDAEWVELVDRLAI